MRRAKMGSVFTQMDRRGMEGKARFGRRVKRGPEPARGGGTSGRTMREGDGEGSVCVDVDEKRREVVVALRAL